MITGAIKNRQDDDGSENSEMSDPLFEMDDLDDPKRKAAASAPQPITASAAEKSPQKARLTSSMPIDLPSRGYRGLNFNAATDDSEAEAKERERLQSEITHVNSLLDMDDYTTETKAVKEAVQSTFGKQMLAAFSNAKQLSDGYAGKSMPMFNTVPDAVARRRRGTNPFD
jgi:hypothetical protein